MSLSWVNDYPIAHDLNVELCLSFSTIAFTALYCEFVDVIINCRILYVLKLTRLHSPLNWNRSDFNLLYLHTLL